MTAASNDLTRFVEATCGSGALRVEENLGAGYVRLRVAEAERRQAKHDIRCIEDVVIEMLRNARDAGARNIYVSIAREENTKTLIFIDDGSGVPEALQEAIFEPRVTSKLESMVMDRWGVHGRGMALYSIRQNSREALVVSSGDELGSAFSVKVDLTRLSEKKDQSTFPKLVVDEDGSVAVGRGPHNIVRCIVEFALEHDGDVNVYMGTPTTIAALLVRDGRKALDEEQLLFIDDLNELPVCLRPAAAADASELMRACAGIGLEIGERTAHRILAGSIEPAQAPLERVRQGVQGHAKGVDIFKDSRGLKISSEDLSQFSRALEDDFDELAKRYYLQLCAEPTIRVGKDKISVTFKVEKEL